MCIQSIRQSRFATIPGRIRTLSRDVMPPERDTVHLALEDLLVLSLLCLFWGVVMYAVLTWGL